MAYLRRVPFKRGLRIRTKKSPPDITPQTKAKLHRKAWQAFSRYIRNRDKRCFTCPTGLAENAGHFWHNVLDFDEENIHGQCVRCNKYLSGNLAVYASNLLRLLGEERFKALEARHYLALKGEYRTEQEYLDIIKKYSP